MMSDDTYLLTKVSIENDSVLCADCIIIFKSILILKSCCDNDDKAGCCKGIQIAISASPNCNYYIKLKHQNHSKYLRQI